MTEGEAPTDLASLPRTIPIFPLAGALLLPRGQLPLNIFEPRYLEMVRDAMAQSRIVGMVQPTDPETSVYEPDVYETGCAGRITTFKETDDGRYLITLSGICRFAIVEEFDSRATYRVVTVSYDDFAGDIETGGRPTLDRERILPALRAYLEIYDMSAAFQALEELPGGPLITALAMLCPFEPSEKQALLEASSQSERGRIVTALLEMAALQHVAGPETQLQ